MFSDLNDENWKNSPVMQIFAANYVSERPVIMRPVDEVTPDTRPPLDLSDSTASYDNFVQKQAALAEIDNLTAGLRQLATEAGLAGRVKAAYDIERTIAEIEQIGTQIIANADA